MSKKELFVWIILGTIGAWAFGHWVLTTFGYNTGMTTLHSLNVGGLVAFIVSAFRISRMLEASARTNAERDQQHALMWQRYEEDGRRRDELFATQNDLLARMQRQLADRAMYSRGTDSRPDGEARK